MANDKAMVESKEAEAYEYIDRGKETVLPHTSRTGGIEGVKGPYPDIQYRKFQGEQLVEEQVLHDIKHRQREEHVQEVSPVQLGAEPLEEPSEPAPRKQASVVKDESIIPAQAPAAVTPDSMTEVLSMMQKMMNEQRVPPPTQLMPEMAKSSSVVETPKETSAVSVTFNGPFGEVTAPFKRCIDGEHCVALVQDMNNQFNYNPPVNDSSVITIEWKDRQDRVQDVINAGLSFKLDGNTKVIILLKS